MYRVGDKDMLKIRENPDKEVVKEIREKLFKANGYCPCKLIHSKKNKCMCEEFRNQSVPGYCHCGLYYKEI